MRPAAKVGKVALTIQRDNLAFRQVTDDFSFVMFAFVVKKFNGIFAGHDNALKLLVAFDDFMHLCLDFFKIFRRERLFAGKVIIKTVFDSRPDGNLNVRPQFFNRLRHNVRTAVAQDV